MIGRRLVSRPALASQEARDSLMEEAGNLQTSAGLWKNRHYWREFERTAAEIPAKVVFLVGGLDPMTSVADTGVMAGLLPHTEIRVLPGGGHAAPLQAPTWPRSRTLWPKPEDEDRPRRTAAAAQYSSRRS